MATMFKWLSRAFVGAVLLGLVALLLAYYLVGRSIPDYERDFAVAGPGDRGQQDGTEDDPAPPRRRDTVRRGDCLHRSTVIGRLEASAGARVDVRFGTA